MKTLFSFICSFIFLTNLFSQSKIMVVEGNNIDFGKIYKGEKITRKFTIKNIGSDTLEVSNVQASCGCTAAMIDKKKIAPNDSGTLSTTFDSKNFSGKVSKTITLTTNDSINLQLPLKFSVTILQEFTLTPQQIIFKEVKLGETAIANLKIKNTSDKPLKLLSWKSSDKNILLFNFPQKEIAPNEEVEIEVKYTTTTSGTYTNTIEITTNGKFQNNLSIRFVGVTKN